ncbi:MAG: NADPH:quinone reductase-like Zn-dependent oxidoreductase [Myxococcota bacterium]|jgi:NADPH:quinone reductase-like Zn-dependent oxidoreductase
MRKAVVTGRGGPEVLSIVEVPSPEPRRGQVRIRVEAAGVAYGDVMRRRGVLVLPGPFTPGYDVVGIIDAVGSGVDPERIGVRVAAMMPKTGFGGYAEQVCMPADRTTTVPDGIDPVDAVALGLNYITARQIIHRLAGLTAGQSLLIHGAAGGVGTAALDIGRAAGLTLYGTASAGKHDIVRDRGGIPIDYRSEDFVTVLKQQAPDGVDAVLDPIGGAHLHRSYATLGPRGTLVVFGVSGDVERGMAGVIAGVGSVLSLMLRLNGKRVRPYGISVSPGTGPASCCADWAVLLNQHAAGEITPLVGARLPLSEVAEAHRLMDAASVVGKIVLTT